MSIRAKVIGVTYYKIILSRSTSYLCNENRVCWKIVSGVDNLLNIFIEEKTTTA